ncbi:uncharacterized protein LOC131008854 isoform X1 [Salvia miltiorrhiza]|uniref:uncharacterized protein LOC131008854 isoform X1 n=1 Tax=Salvia miltiorrhiza TaxID=226208 RepID=UPI0025AC9C6D|nr:uncharacterized protein LOC131008854 isoform X1 [Salvia miltiorrhiza]
MDEYGEQKPDPSLLKLQVESLELNRTLSFKEWMNKRTTSPASPDGVSSKKVRSSVAPQTQTGGLLMIKIKDVSFLFSLFFPLQVSHHFLLLNPQIVVKAVTFFLPRFMQQEPLQGPPGLSYDEHLASAARDWIGTSKASSNKFQTHPPPNELPIPNLYTKPNQVEGLKLLPEAGIPTRPDSFLKRKARDSEQPEKLATPPLLPTNNDSKMGKPGNNLLCHLCNVSCSSALTLKQHLVGRPHKAKIKYMKMKRGTTSSNTWGRQGGEPRCDICEIWCPDVGSLQMHFKGQKHKAKVQESSKERGGQKSSKAPIICDVCRVPCMDQELFQQHLKGKQHATKQELKRRGFL